MSVKEEVQALLKSERTVRVDPVLESLVPRFLENRKRDVAALYGALGDGDFTTIGSIGHAMKGTGGGYGFHAISALGKEIEDAARAEDGVGATQWITALEDYLKRVKVLYEEPETP